MRSPSEVLASMLQIFESGDTSDLSMIAEDYLDHQGLGTPLVGPDGFRQVVDAVQHVYPELVIEVRGETVFSTYVSAVLRWNYTDENGRSARRETLECLAVSDGRAKEHWGVRLADAATAVQTD